MLKHFARHADDDDVDDDADKRDDTASEGDTHAGRAVEEEECGGGGVRGEAIVVSAATQHLLLAVRCRLSTYIICLNKLSDRSTSAASALGCQQLPDVALSLSHSGPHVY